MLDPHGANRTVGVWFVRWVVVWWSLATATALLAQPVACSVGYWDATCDRPFPAMPVKPTCPLGQRQDPAAPAVWFDGRVWQWQGLQCVPEDCHETNTCPVTIHTCWMQQEGQQSAPSGGAGVRGYNSYTLEYPVDIPQASLAAVGGVGQCYNGVGVPNVQPDTTMLQNWMQYAEKVNNCVVNRVSLYPDAPTESSSGGKAPVGNALGMWRAEYCPIAW